MAEQKKEEAPKEESKKGLVVITGASSGIGAECAREFHKAGHPILCLARRVDKMKKDLSDLKDKIEFTKCDVTNFKEFQDAITGAEEKFGPTDCLINNAGVMLLGDMDTQDKSQWTKMIDVNINGVLNGMKIVTANMKKRKAGTIINISSLAGHKHFDQHTVYCATKYAVRALSEGLRQELATSNVKVCIISPAVVETELLGHTSSDKIKDGYNDWKKTMELGALLPIDIANCAMYIYNTPPRCCVREVVIAPTNQVP
mmetsp:Transcript_30382/g.26806  ORF Transcript_30382/g.26806 Transcript_30382/m.26806 type:complete len:258 (+) Transcript_30382:103-876(+)|eukprot:CAMPEP_0201576356 /NCGR_PEP_ID=MMETSP0190_2-20130828/22113_1 /ASSEMBLY_ACC=CAM_ASM_000263 /TAXON_ID=37353 /ORGANISM="Rosalina sp." /LENGTH=257 /DNA_ID=CAMNT_0048007117 /DNA_START=89 /DNA_END=862 /DNA_ORIENTATION=-